MPKLLTAFMCTQETLLMVEGMGTEVLVIAEIPTQ